MALAHNYFCKRAKIKMNHSTESLKTSLEKGKGLKMDFEKQKHLQFQQQLKQSTATHDQLH